MVVEGFPLHRGSRCIDGVVEGMHVASLQGHALFESGVISNASAIYEAVMVLDMFGSHSGLATLNVELPWRMIHKRRHQRN